MSTNNNNTVSSTSINNITMSSNVRPEYVVKLSTPKNQKISSNENQITDSKITVSDPQIEDSSKWNTVVNKSTLKKEEKRVNKEAKVNAIKAKKTIANVKSVSEPVPIVVQANPADTEAIEIVPLKNLQGAWKIRAESLLLQKEKREAETIVVETSSKSVPKKPVDTETAIMPQDTPEVSVVTRVKKNGYVKNQNDVKVSKPKHAFAKSQNDVKVSKPKQSIESKHVRSEKFQQPPPHMMGPLPHMMGPSPHMIGPPPHMMGLPPHIMGFPPHMMGFHPHMMGFPPHMMGFPPHMMGFHPYMMGPPPAFQTDLNLGPIPPFGGVTTQLSRHPPIIEHSNDQQNNLIADQSKKTDTIAVEPKQKVPVVREPNAKGCIKCTFKKCSKRTCGFVHSGQMCIHNHRVYDGEICEVYAKLCSLLSSNDSEKKANSPA